MIFLQEIEDDICKIGLFIGDNERKLELLHKQKGDIEQSIEKLQGQELISVFWLLSLLQLTWKFEKYNIMFPLHPIWIFVYKISHSQSIPV